MQTHAEVIQERDDLLFALQALCEELNAKRGKCEYTVQDALQAAREYRDRAISFNKERN